VIETRGLRYEYKAGPVISFEDVDVQQGGTLLLHGNSGAGKSTWLALAAGLLTPDAGEIVMAGQPLSGLTGAERDAWRARHLGFLPQKLHLSEALSVERNLALAFYAAGVAENRSVLLRALELLGVADLGGRRPSQLSGGQAQRVALARTILMEPQVILADEPTASLDDESARTGLKLLEDCAARCNATLVIATHDRRVQEALPAARVYRIGRQTTSVRGTPS
jgi:putative ABC transport system ATP-binding protein